MSKNQIVTTKRVLLNSPGERLSDIYYRDSETRVQDVETLGIMGRFEQTLILNWGSKSNIQIPNSGNILHQVFLHMKLPQIVADQFVNRGWLYNAIESITWTLGSSTQSQLLLPQKSIFQTAMSMMKTAEERSQALRAGGGEHVDPTTDSICATIIIPLPWSSMRSDGDNTKKGIDTSLLNSNINLQITLSSADKVYGGIGQRPTGPLEAFIFTREEVLTNQNNSIRNVLMNNSEKMYSYPFIHKQAPTPRQVVINNPSVVNLAEILESDLQAITWTAHLNDDANSGSNNRAPNVLLPLECIDIELKYNGQTIFKAPGRTSHLIPSLYDGGASHVEHSRILRTGDTSGQNSVPANSYVYYIPFASMFHKNINYEGMYSNSPRFANQTMQLSLTVLDAPEANSPPLTGATIYFTYYYSGVAEISAGVSTITFA